MSPRELEKYIQQFYPQLSVRFHRGMQRFIVVEEKKERFIITLTDQPQEYQILHVVQHENGDFRKPNFSDLKAVQEKVDPAFSYRTGIDAEIDRLDMRTLEREGQISKEVEAMVDEVVDEHIIYNIRKRKTTRMAA